MYRLKDRVFRTKRARRQVPLLDRIRFATVFADRLMLVGGKDFLSARPEVAESATVAVGFGDHYIQRVWWTWYTSRLIMLDFIPSTEMHALGHDCLTLLDRCGIVFP